MTPPCICKTIDSRYKCENKQIIKQNKNKNNVAGQNEYKREKHINKNVNTNKHIQIVMRNTASTKNRSELSALERQINDRKYRRDSTKWAIQRYWQNRVHKTKTNKSKTQRNSC